MDSREVIVSEEGVLSKHSFQTTRLCSHQSNVSKDACALVTVNDVNLLSNQNLTNQRKRVEEAHEGNITLTDRNLRNMINFEAVCHVSHSASIILELIGHKTDLVSSLD